jgi:phosphoglycolate phosphatase-like HAD superfamily hydrolase
VFVIFDYDGVIFNSGPAVKLAVSEFYRHLDLPEPDLGVWKSWLGPPIVESVERTLAAHALDGQNVDDLSNTFFHQINAATRVHGTAFPGAVELIQDLQSAGALVGIATMKAHTEIAELRDMLPALDFVDAYHAPQDHHGGTSKKALVGDVMASLGVTQATEGWMVGDRASDIEAGQTYGLKTVAVTWGAGTRDELEATRPSFLIDDMTQLRQLLL